MATFDKAKLNRGQEDAKNAPKKPHEAPAPAEEAARAPDMPAMGGGAAPVGAAGPEISNAEGDEAAKKEQQAELERLKGLPPGDPELEKYKNPKALGEKVPEGGGATGKAKEDAKGMSPKQEQQGQANLGPSTQTAKAEPGGAGVKVDEVKTYDAPPASGIADQAVAAAGSPVAPGPVPTEKAQEKGPAASKKDVAPEPADQKAPEAPKDTKIDVAEGKEPAKASATDAKAPTATPEKPKTGDASAEGKAGKEPEKAPEAQPKAAAGGTPDAPQGAPAPAPDAGNLEGEKTAPLAVPTGAPAPAKDGTVAEMPVVEAAVAAQNVPDQLPGGVEGAPEGKAGEPAKNEERAPGESGPTPAPAPEAKAPEAAVAQAPEAQPQVVDKADAKVGLAVGQPDGAPSPVAAAGGAEVAPNAGRTVTPEAAGANVAGEVKTAPDGSVPGVQGSEEQAPEGSVDAGSGSAPGAATPEPGSVAGAPERGKAPPASAKGETGLNEVIADTKLPDLKVAAGELTDKFAGRTAAGELGQKVFGLTADAAGELSKLAPEGMAQDAVQAIADVAGSAGVDPNSMVKDEVAKRERMVEDLLKGKGGEAVKGVTDLASKGLGDLKQVGQDTAEKLAGGLDELKGLGDQALKDLGKKGEKLLGKKVDAGGIGKMAGAFKKDPGQSVKGLLGEGEKLAGGVKQKAEAALGKSLGDISVHTGDLAQGLADSVGATAFAQGKDIVVGKAGQLTGDAYDKVMAEEIVHTRQQTGETGKGVSEAVSKAEKAAQAAALRVLKGAEIKGLAADDEQKALYRNTGGGSTASSAPTQVVLNMGGKSITVKLPQISPGTTSKQVSLPSLGIQGLTIKSMALMRFDASSSAFKGGVVDGTIQVGQVMSRPQAKIQIAENGTMTASFANTPLKVGELIDSNVTANITAAGVTGTGDLRYSDLRGDKLTQWLKSGSMHVDVSSEGNVTGSGNLGIEIEPFSVGTLAATIQNNSELTGKVDISNSKEIALPPKSTVSTGTLSGQLTGSNKVELSGDLKLSIETLGGGEGKLSAKWDSESTKISGAAALTSSSASLVGKANITQATVTGEAAETKLDKVEGSGKLTYDSLFEGDWNGSIDLQTDKATFTLGGKLMAPIIQGEVTVENGALTLQVEDDVLKSTAGNVDFKLSSFLKGTAVLEEGTNANNVNATATAELVSAQTFDGVTLSKGSITVKVRGTQIEVVSGSVDMTYRDVAKGQLNLSQSNDYRKFSGNGKATLNEGLVWGDIKVKEGDIDVDMKQNKVETAQGQMKIEYLDFVEGQMSFDAKKDFNQITGTATSKVTNPHGLTSPLELQPGDKAHDLRFENTQFKGIKGAFDWKADKFSGDVTQAAEINDYGLITGEGKADLNADLPIGSLSGSEMIGKQGSTLTGKLQDGSFQGIKGTLKWQYQEWLAGDFNIPAFTPTIRELNGQVQAQLIAKKALPNNPKVEMQPGAAGALRVNLVNSVPKRYSGTLDYIFDSFLKGQVTVSGPMLDFSQLSGKSQGTVVAPKDIKNVKVLEGSTMNVEFVDSNFSNFDGAIKYQYQTWLKGDATADSASSMTVGVSAMRASGKLEQTPPGSGGKFKELPESTVNIDIVPNTEITKFKSGSNIKWQYEDWLSGDAMALTQDSLFGKETEKTTGKFLKEKILPQQPQITLLPTDGVGVELAGGEPVKYSGSVKAKIEDWISGDLNLGANSNASVFYGDLVGNILKEKQIGSSPTTLIPGGPVTVQVDANRAAGLSGSVPVKYGADEKWLQGKVDGQTAAGDVVSLSGEFSGKVIARRDLGEFGLETGGSIATPMASNNIQKLAGSVNFTSKQGSDKKWLKGKLTITEANSTDLLSGDYSGKITADLTAGTNVKLKGGSVTGTIQQNQVKTLGGSVKIQYEDWLEGTIQAQPAKPNKIGGEGPGKFIKDLPIVPAKLFIAPGGSPQIKLENGLFKKFWGEVNWRWEDWVKGTATVTEGTKDNVDVSAAQGTIIKAYHVQNSEAMLFPGGSFSVKLGKTGVDDFTGSVNVEYGKDTGGTTWHTKGTIELAAAKLSNLKGKISGGLASEKKYEPSLRIKKGGLAEIEIDSGIKSVKGSLDYELTKGTQGRFIEGSASGVAATGQGATITADLGGRIVATQTFGKGNAAITVLEGGSLQGKLESATKATLGGKLNVKVGDTINGSIEVQGQIDPSDPKISGRVEGTTAKNLWLDMPGGGKIVINQGSGAGAKLTDNSLESFWGNLSFSTQAGQIPSPIWTSGQLQGSISVPEGNNSKPDDISGTATARFGGMSGAAPGLALLSAQLTINVEHNEFKGLSGTAKVAYKGTLMGDLSIQADSTLTNLSGRAQMTLIKRLPAGSSTFALLPGGNVNADIANNELTGVGGQILWEYGEGGWLTGDITVPDGTKLESPSGSGTARVKTDKVVAGELKLKAGGSLTAQVASGEPTSFRGKVLWAYGAGEWLEGDVTIADGSKIDQINGSATAKLAKDKQVAGELKLLKGGHLTLTMQNNAPGPFDGEVNWEYQDWLGGKVTVQGATIENISGDATANIKKEKEVSPGLELQKGGSAQVHVEAAGIKEFSGSVDWKYGQGEKWAKGSVTVAGKSSFDSISGKATAQLLKDLQFTDVRVLKEGSNLEVNIEAGAIKTFGGSAVYMYGQGEWLKGTVTVDPKSTPEQVSGDATAEIVVDKLVDGSELTLKTGSSGKTKLENNQVKSLSGTLNWEYGIDPWLKGTISVNEGSTPDKVTGKVSGSLMKNYILSEKVSLKEGGNIAADYDGQTLKNFSGQVMVLYEDWLEGTLTLNNANLDNVTGSLQAQLILDKPLDDKITLKRGGSVKVEMANNDFTSFTGDVNWQYETWLEGNLNVTAGTGKEVTGTGTATIKEQKQLGEGGKLEIQRGSSVQAKVTGNQFDGAGGDIAWKYENWLKGTVSVPAYTKLDKVSGTVTATLIDQKDAGSEIVLKSGGSVTGELKDGAITKIGGNVEWKYQDWLGGSVTLNPSPLDHLTGKAEAHVIKRKDVKPPFVVERGGSLQVDFDTKKSLSDTPFQANLTWEYDKWLGGDAQIDAGSTFSNLNGRGRVVLKDEKTYGDVTLRRGGEARVEIKASAPDSFGGDLNFKYQNWLGGTINIKDGSKLDSISGKATAAVTEDKQFGDITLKTGGNVEANVEGSSLTTFGGTVYLNWKGWIDAELSVDKASTKDSITGKGTATLAKDFPVNGSEFIIKQGSSASVDIKNSTFEGISGSLSWKYQDWVQGKVTVTTSKLESVDGTAEANIVKEKELAAKMKLLPGGSANVTIAANALTEWGGQVNWQYDDLLKGNLAIEGKSSLESIRGTVDATLIKDYDLPAGDVKLLNGSRATVTASPQGVEKFSGKIRFQHSTWLQGAIDVADSTPESISGHATARIIEEKQVGGGQFYLLQGGNLTVDFKNSTFDGIEGQVDWEYKNPDAHLQGAITIPRSKLDAINGSADAHLMEDTKEVRETKLLAGGTLKAEVVASKPDAFGGRVDWQHSNWIGGYVEVPNGTKFAGPYTGRAGAILKEDKPVGDKFTLKKGGNVNLSLDTAQSLEDQQIDGRVAIDYETWLRGTLTVDSGSTFKTLNGSAQVELLETKEIGSSGFKLIQGGNAKAKFAGGALTTFGGLVMVEYQDWLAGSIRIDESSTIESITGTATLQLKADKTFGDVTLKQGGDLQVNVTGSQLGTFGGAVNIQYQDWLEGNLVVDSSSTFESISGNANAHLIAEKSIGSDFTLKPPSNVRAKMQANAITSFGGQIDFAYQDWLTGNVSLTGEADLKSLSGQASVYVSKDKDLPAQVKIKQGSAATAQMEALKFTSLSGSVKFQWTDYVGGSISLGGGSTFDSISGHASFELLKDKEVGAGVKLIKGGTAEADFAMGTGITNFGGSLKLGYQDWLEGTITVTPGSTWESVSGKAGVQVKQPKKFGPIEIKTGSFLEADFAANTVTEFRGNVEVGYEDWLKGNLNFKAQSLESISGSGSLNVTKDYTRAGPLSILKGSYVKVNFENSALKDFGGTAKIGVKEWGEGELTIKDGSTTDNVSGSGEIRLTSPKKFGEYVTLKSATLGAEVEANSVKSIWGDATAEIKDMGEGWLKISKQTTINPPSFTGQAGLKLTTPKKIGNFAELSGGQIIANFEANALKDFGGFVDIKIFGWGKGNVTIDQGSTLEDISGSASVELTEPKDLAGGKVKITGGSVSGRVDHNKLTKIAGSIKAELTGIAKGEVQGELDVEKQLFSGSGKLTQIKPWTAGPVKIENAELSATITENRLTGASGKGSVDAGKFGKGTFEVNYEDVGGQPLFYGRGEIDFKPHDRIWGKLKINFSREQKLTGEGEVTVKISDKVQGKVGVALDEQGHVKIRGSVTIPGPFELFNPRPFKKDIKLLDLSFVVYTPPTVKVKVGAGLGIEAGIKPLTISNIVVGGEVDLMEPSFANMSVTGHLASSAYVDLNAYVEGSVQVSAAVVAVEAGLRAALNLHLEAAISADPTITVDRNGLRFDMPVDARLSAALNLILTFFAKVKVGLDLGFFSIMKTVWQYDKSPNPLRLAEMAIGAKGRVQAGAGGFNAEFNPEYQPPDLSLEKLKQAIGL